MKPNYPYHKPIISSLGKWLGLVLLFLLLTGPAYAQTTKGDDMPSRESRFKSKPKKEKAKKGGGKRIAPMGKSRATSGTRGERAWSGDLTGRKVPSERARNKPTKSGNVYPQRGPFVRKTRPPASDDASYKSQPGASAQPRVRSSSNRARNVYPQKGPYVAKTRPPSNDDRSPRVRGTAVSRQPARTRSAKMQNVYPQRGPYVAKTRPPSSDDRTRNWRGSTVRRPVVRSSTGSTRNVFPQRGAYVAKTRPPRVSDASVRWGRTTASRARSQSATGRTRNVFAPKGPYVSSATIRPRQSERPPGKRRGKYPASASKPFLRSKSINPYAGFWNKKQKGEKAFIGDISGKRLRTKDFETPRGTPEEYDVNPYVDRKRKTGDVPYSQRARVPLSATKSGRAWQGDIAGRRLRTLDQSSKGKIEAGQPLGRIRYGDKRVGQYSGSIKAQRPLKGGGSVSGQMWNNKGEPLVGKAPKASALKMAAYSGNIKASKPRKGGGSVSGQLWNNNEKPIAGRAPKGAAAAIGSYQGSIKASKKEPSKEVGGFPGKYRMFDVHPSMRNQGEEFTGYIRRPFLRNDYIRNPNAARESLKKARPGDATKAAGKLQVKVRQEAYVKKPNATPGSMRGIAPNKSTVRASEYAKGARLDRGYIRNPSSDKEALKVREPGKAYAREADYQGNIKMKKQLFGNKGLHPDAQFVKTNKNNVSGEKGVFTSLKLWWAKSFKKSDTQPSNLKEKVRKPRYDKGEQGLWYD